MLQPPQTKLAIRLNGELLSKRRQTPALASATDHSIRAVCDRGHSAKKLESFPQRRVHKQNDSIDTALPLDSNY